MMFYGYGSSDSDDSDEAETRPSSVKSSEVRDGSELNMKHKAKMCAIFADQCKFIPMRLTEDERVYLKVLESALEVCEYTDVVDVQFSHSRKSKLSRIMECLVDVLSISCGLMASNNLSVGENLIVDRSLNNNIPFFRDIFEVGRRFKIMNPHKMRNTYGKLMCIMMDCESEPVKADTAASFLKPILTARAFLDSKGALPMLTDPLLFTATFSSGGGEEFSTVSNTEPLAEERVQRQKAREQLVAKYTTDTMSASDVIRVVESVSDHQSYYGYNVKPVEQMIHLLTTYFSPKKANPLFSLDLRGSSHSNTAGIGSGYFLNNLYDGLSSRILGSGGAKLSHDHATQYVFALQSLTLWSEIMLNMPKLWYLADLDMTQEHYRLCDTGQGYQRVQQCPRVAREMGKILETVKRRIPNRWVGLSVVHLGDRDVPNALVFIDKYTQVPRILNPLVACVSALPGLMQQDPHFSKYVAKEWGSVDGLRLQILCDFFKHAYDGSGDDGGSCIDGRLTSAWNWCSKIQKKPFYYIFMLAGFEGFDGEWKG